MLFAAMLSPVFTSLESESLVWAVSLMLMPLKIICAAESEFIEGRGEPGASYVFHAYAYSCFAFAAIDKILQHFI